MKKISTFITAVFMTAFLCACGADIREENVVEDISNITEITDEMSEEDMNSFAAGISNNDDGSVEMDNDPEIVHDDEIEERCPSKYSSARLDVKYGEYSHGTYYSETCGMTRGYSVLLPADYSTEKKYPVLYLLHGIFGDEYSFSNDPGNSIREIAGNMAADGLVEETVIVCPNMYAASDPAQKPAFDAESCIPYDNFINDLINDLMPHIESEYSVLSGRENTYLAGFSMGGRETIYITLQRPELFGYVCAISPAPGIVPTTDKFMTHPGQMTESDSSSAAEQKIPWWEHIPSHTMNCLRPTVRSISGMRSALPIMTTAQLKAVFIICLNRYRMIRLI